MNGTIAAGTAGVTPPRDLLPAPLPLLLSRPSTPLPSAPGTPSPNPIAATGRAAAASCSGAESAGPGAPPPASVRGERGAAGGSTAARHRGARPVRKWSGTEGRRGEERHLQSHIPGICPSAGR